MSDFWDEMSLRLPRKFMFKSQSEKDSLSVLSYDKKWFTIQIANNSLSKVVNMEVKRKDFKRMIKMLEKSVLIPCPIRETAGFETKNKDFIRVNKYHNLDFWLNIENIERKLNSWIKINGNEIESVIKGLKELKK